MINPIFNNIPNRNIKVKHENEDLDIWLSRSAAVVAVVFASTKNGLCVLITKRSEKMKDEAGKISLPCGYLDWNESGYDAMIREVYEETSLYLPNYKKNVIFDNDKKPFDIKDDPSVNRQNVTLLYMTVLDFKKANIFPIDVEKYKCEETEWVKWMKLVDFYNSDYYWAFDHDITIKNALKIFNKT